VESENNTKLLKIVNVMLINIFIKLKLLAFLSTLLNTNSYNVSWGCLFNKN